MPTGDVADANGPDAGKVAVVTGAGSGIGRATALRLHRAGFLLSLFDVRPESLQHTVFELAGRDAEPVTNVGDVRSRDDLEAAAARTVERFGRIDACAACAGVEVSGGLIDTPPSDWERAISVNLMGVVNTAIAVLPSLVASGSGAFVAISSDAGTHGFPEWATYCVSKHGVVGLVRAMAVEFGPAGVRSNVVCPSFVETPMAERILAGTTDDERQAWERTVPLGRFAKAEEIANVVVHLLSAEASYTNGLVYAVDGGETAGFIP